MASRTAFLLFLGLLFVSARGHAGILSIVTDQKDMSAANAFRDLLRKTTCFRDLKNLEIKITVIDSERLKDCGFHALVTRLYYCKNGYSQFASETNADKVMLIKESDKYGGSGEMGGLGGAATTSSPPIVALHELLHTIGFADEYAYTNEAEANKYCSARTLAPNLATFLVKPPYSSDGDARARHAGDIPWYSRINASSISAPPELGTTEHNKTGLYPAKTCEKATTGFKSWRPGQETSPNAMATNDTENPVPQTFCPAIRQAFNEPGDLPVAAPPQSPSGNRPNTR